MAEIEVRLLRLAFTQPMDPVHRAALELVIGVHPVSRSVREGDYLRLIGALEEVYGVGSYARSFQ